MSTIYNYLGSKNMNTWEIYSNIHNNYEVADSSLTKKHWKTCTIIAREMGIKNITQKELRFISIIIKEIINNSNYVCKSNGNILYCLKSK